MVSFTLNNRQVSVDADPGTPLLWAIRELAGITGTKFGCGVALRRLHGARQRRGERSCVARVGAMAGATSPRSRALGQARARGSGGLDHGGGGAVRLLPVRKGHGGVRPAGAEG